MEQEKIIEELEAFVGNNDFPCIGAKTAIIKGQLKCLVVGNMHSDADDEAILKFLYAFIEDYRSSEKLFHSAAIIFTSPTELDEEMYEQMLWQRLQSLADKDAKTNPYDARVSNHPTSPHFSFSIGEEALFVVGLHPSNSRLARRFKYPTLIFNPHAQFEKLRETDLFEHLKKVIRTRDEAYSGSVNPMLTDFGKSSEVYQYSGRKYDEQWQCPLKINNGKDKHNTPS